VKNKERIIPNSSTESKDPNSLDLSSIPSKSETEPNLLETQVLAKPRNGNLISFSQWTPIDTSQKYRVKKKPAQIEEEPTRYPEWTPDVYTYFNKPKKPKRK
jgi:hypothetical protein